MGTPPPKPITQLRGIEISLDFGTDFPSGVGLLGQMLLGDPAMLQKVSYRRINVGQRKRWEVLLNLFRSGAALAQADGSAASKGIGTRSSAAPQQHRIRKHARDLFQLPTLDVADVLPPDPTAYGFDNVAEGQDVSYVQLARYLDAAQIAIDSAMCLNEKPETERIRIKFQDVGRFGAGKKHGDRGRGEARHIGEWVVFLRQPNNAQTPWRIGRSRMDRAGMYRFRIRVKSVVFDDWELRPPDRNHVAGVYVEDARNLYKFDVPAEPSIVEFKSWLNRNEQLVFFCATLDDRNSPGAGKFEDPYTGPGIAVDWMEIEGPVVDGGAGQWPWESHRRLFGDLPVVPYTPESGLRKPEPLHENFASIRRTKGDWMVASENPEADAERLLRVFMERLYRRPTSESEVERCLKFAKDAIADHCCFQDAMRLAYQAALCSPDFLYLLEEPGGLDGVALAARLSYFLWRSAPDEELRELGLSGRLTDPDLLREQTERLLNDPRSGRFVEDFTGQWLEPHEIRATAPDRELYPEYFCDIHLIESAVDETLAFSKDGNYPLPNIFVSMLQSMRLERDKFATSTGSCRGLEIV